MNFFSPHACIFLLLLFRISDLIPRYLSSPFSLTRLDLRRQNDYEKQQMEVCDVPFCTYRGAPSDHVSMVFFVVEEMDSEFTHSV